MKSCAAVEENQEALPEGLSAREIPLPSPLCTPVQSATGGGGGGRGRGIGSDHSFHPAEWKWRRID